MSVDAGNRSDGRDTLSAGLQPLQVSAKVAAPLAGVSVATWWRLHAAGKVPAPAKLGGRTLWRVDELREWVAAGCPARAVWDAQRLATGHGPTRNGAR
jgi:predicted DNA-binding transcriptional regulator AlpA